MFKRTANNKVSYAVVGDADTGYPIYQLNIYDFLEILDPPKGLDIHKVDPKDYFITSGDAIQKSKFLSKVLWKHAGEVRKQINSIKKPSKEIKEFEKKCWRQAGSIRKLIGQLERIRGDDVFLETEWDEHKLWCIPKNPRKM